MYKPLNTVIHAPLRLSIINLLVNEKVAEFNHILQKTNATSGNLSSQLNKLKIAGYIDVVKQFRDNYPLTVCSITQKGIDAFNEYAETMKSYLV